MMRNIEISKSYICNSIGTNYEVISHVECTYTNNSVLYVKQYNQRNYSVIYDASIDY